MDVHVLTVGGTIDKVYHDALSDYTVGPPAVEQILSEAKISSGVTVVSLLRRDSIELANSDRARIVEEVRRVPSDRVILTHGTDTMAETAKALIGVQGKTIVLTGAFSPAKFRDSDAAFNVGYALGVCQLLRPGVYIAMNGRIFKPNQVAKDRRTGAFVETTDVI